MGTRSFQATLLSGHKEDAVEVPFDPAEALGISLEPLEPGRRGFRVTASVNGTEFQSAIVPRSKRFWLLVPTTVERTTGIAAGDTVAVLVLA